MYEFNLESVFLSYFLKKVKVFWFFGGHAKSLPHVQVAQTPVLALHNLWRQIHMFLDILEFRVEN